jgi:hypothetical protein
MKIFQRTIRSVLVVGVVATIVGTGGLLRTAPASSASVVTVARPGRVGTAPALPRRTRALGALAPTARLRVTVTLRPPHPVALARYATAVSTPGSVLYRHYLRPAGFAARFGPSVAAIRVVEDGLRASGLHPGPVAADRLSIPVTGTTDAMSRAFATGFERYQLADGRKVYANTRPPLVDGIVEDVIGLDTLHAPEPLGLSAAVRSPAADVRPHRPLRPQVVTGGPQPCAAATAAGPLFGRGAYTSDRLASAYGFTGLYGAGDLGAGQTVALFELEPALASDISAFQACYGTATPVTYVPVDGGAGYAGAGQGEAALDIEDVIGLAPEASVIVYEGPDAGTGVYDTYSAIISEDRATVISTSWGECEASEGVAAAQAEGVLFEEAATQGQTVVAAAGDHGSEDCLGTSGASTQLAVDDPASQPYVTAVGGTTLASAGPPPSETVWKEDGAGGGGVSSLWAMPAYQSGAPASLHVNNVGSTGVPCAAAAGSYCREVPDVSADADPYTAYVVYYEGAWTALAGTSAAAPLWAAFIALTNAAASCDGADVGFANPSLYALAGGDGYTTDFHDITTGDNDLHDPDLGTYTAGTGYDMASGLGSPDGSALTAALCALAVPADTVTVVDPGAQRSTVGSTVTLTLTGTDSAPSRSLAYEASALPLGLSINATSGVISGIPAQSGSTDVVVTAVDATGASGTASFVWTVDALPPPAPPAPTAVACTARQLLVNADFDSGSAAPWKTRSRLVQRGSRAQPAQSGPYLVRMHGGRSPVTETLSQTVTIPAACTTDQFSWWLHVDTSEHTTRSVDTLQVQVLDPAGRVLSTLATYSNRSTRRGYRRVSVGLAGVAGSTITVRFTAIEGDRAGGTTDFCIDDTSLQD